jgi:hypothetical protein
MSEPEAGLIQKIASHEGKLIEIYRLVYSVMKTHPNVPAHVIPQLKNLDPPDNIQPAKAAAILKSIMGSVAGDKFSLEDCCAWRMPDGKYISDFIRDELHQVGINYHDLYPYLEKHGWYVPEPNPSSLTPG